MELQVQKSFETKDDSSFGKLYVVGTPIGNLEDLSPRAIEVLRSVDVIAAEDTRHTRKLLQVYQFHTPLWSYHEHNQRTKGEEILSALEKGKNVALVSDAGLPGISDPGEDLVRKATERGFSVVPIPGPNAGLTGLVASGLPTQPFLFLGFLPRHSKERKQALEKWRYLSATLICYEAPHRLESMLTDVYNVMGDRKVAICRELTKKHEEWLRGRLSDCLNYIRKHGVRGEYTVIISGNYGEDDTLMDQTSIWWESLSVVEHVHTYIDQGISKKEAIQLAAKDRKVPKREVYQLFHQEVDESFGHKNEKR